MADGELDPEFEARLWEFIADVRDGTARDRPDVFEIAQWLVASWRVTLVQFYVQAHGVALGEAESLVDEIIDDRRAMWASFAAMPPDL